MFSDKPQNLSEAQTHDVRSASSTLLNRFAFIRLEDIKSLIEIDSTQTWFPSFFELEEGKILGRKGVPPQDCLLRAEQVRNTCSTASSLLVPLRRHPTPQTMPNSLSVLRCLPTSRPVSFPLPQLLCHLRRVTSPASRSRFQKKSTSSPTLLPQSHNQIRLMVWISFHIELDSPWNC